MIGISFSAAWRSKSLSKSASPGAEKLGHSIERLLRARWRCFLSLLILYGYVWLNKPVTADNLFFFFFFLLRLFYITMTVEKRLEI